jgi:hypothetical protein
MADCVSSRPAFGPAVALPALGMAQLVWRTVVEISPMCATSHIGMRPCHTVKDAGTSGKTLPAIGDTPNLNFVNIAPGIVIAMRNRLPVPSVGRWIGLTASCEAT